jgi:PAS domain S-box-containing protein
MNITPAGLVPQAVASQHLPSQTPSPIKTSQRLPSVRSLLLCLVMGCMVPGIGAGVFLFMKGIQDGRQQLEQSSLQTVHALALALDQQFSQVETTAVMLSQDPALQSNNLALFHDHAIAALARLQLGGSVVVCDKRGQALLNTRVRFGTALPLYGNQEQLRQVFATGQPVISDVFMGTFSKKPAVTVAVPVINGEKIVYFLSLSFNPERINALIRQQNFPKDWLVAALDSQSNIAARSHAFETFAGQKSVLTLLPEFNERSEGFVEVASKEGVPTLSAFSTAPHSHWRVGIGIPRKGLESALMRKATLLGLGLFLLLGLGIVLAVVLGRRIASSVTGLTRPARSLVEGTPPRVPAVYFQEAHDVASAMAYSAQMLDLKTSQAQTAMQNLLTAKQALKDLNLNLEAQVKERTQALDDLYNQAPCGYHSLDAQGRILRVNDTELQMLGYAREDLLGLSYFELLTPHSQVVARRVFQEFKRIGRQRNLELDMVRADGVVVPFLVSGDWVLDANGHFLFTHSTLVDNTDRKRKREQLQMALQTAEAAQQEFQDLYHNAPCGYHSLDAEGHITNMNQTALDLMGYRREEVIGQTPNMFFDAENRAKFAQIFPQLMRDGNIENVEHEVLCKDGSRLQVLISSKLFFDAQGQVAGSHATLIDNSVNKARQQQIDALNRFLSEVLESLPLGVLVFDKARHVVLKNQLLGRMLDYPAELMARDNVHLSEFVLFDYNRGDHPHETYDAVLASRLDWMATPEAVRRERRRNNGMHLAITGQRVTGDWYLLTYADITESKRLSQALEDAKQVADDANLAKTQFLSTISHELRSPLHTMLGNLGILRKLHAQTLDPHLQVADKNAAQLLWLIDDLLDFNTDAMRRDALQPDWMALAYLRDTLLNFGHIAAAKADNRFTMAIAPEVPAQLLVDERRLLQVLQNLVGNAAKYTQQGHISLCIERLANGVEREGVLHQTIRFSVQDSGRGIAEHDLQHIFEPLYRSASALDQSGIGLGLAIARQWVRNMGGDIAVSSALGRGSTFHFDLALEGSDVALGDAGVALSVRNECALQQTTTLLAPPASALPQVEAAITMGRLLRVVDWAHALASDARYTATALQVIELAEAADLPALQRLLALWQRQTTQTT